MRAWLACMVVGTAWVLPMVRSCTYHACLSGLRLLKEGRDCGAALHGMGLYMCGVSADVREYTYLPS